MGVRISDAFGAAKLVIPSMAAVITDPVQFPSVVEHSAVQTLAISVAKVFSYTLSSQCNSGSS